MKARFLEARFLEARFGTAARRRALLAGAVLLLAIVLGAGRAGAAPTDIVPRGSVAYDLLGALALSGNLPNQTLRDFFRGDRLYTRDEIAGFVAGARAAATELPPDRALALALLEREFAPELRLRGITPAPIPTGTALLTGAYKVRGLTDPEALSHDVRAAGVVPLGRHAVGAIGLGTWRSEWYDQARRRYPLVESAWVRIDGRALDVTIGRLPLRWGPGRYGALLFDEAAPTIPQVRVEKSFLLPGSLGRRVGRLNFTEFAGQFFEDDVPAAAPNARGTCRYLLGRRLETLSDRRWNFSLAESFKSTRLPDPWFALILPFYSYQNDWTRESSFRLFGFLASDPQTNTFWLNYVASAGASYRADGRGTMLYADLLVDDIEAPHGLGLGNDVPRKIGAQFGVYAPNLDGTGRFAGRLEFSTIDATTFTNISPPVSWTRGDLPLGFPAGPNARVFYARLDTRVTDRVQVAVDGSIRRRKSDSEPGPDQDRLGLYATYALRPDAFVGARLEHRRDALPGQSAQTRTRLELNAAVGF